MAKFLSLFWLIVLSVVVGCSSSIQGDDSTTATTPEKILVLGASGKSGRYINAQLAAQNRNFVAATSNIERARERFTENYDWVELDVRDPASVQAAMTGVSSIISALGATTFKGDNGPEFVDYLGVRNVVDAALQADVKHMVLISSSGVTDPDHILNKLGDVMVWKLKGEDYLRASGLPYTIIRPGGLLDNDSGTHRLLVRQGDDLPYTSKLSVTGRGDVAMLAIAALDIPALRNVTFEAFNDRDAAAEADWSTQLTTLVPD